MKRGHIRVGRGFGKQLQEKLLKDAGVAIIYENDPASAVKSCRNGVPLYVVGLRGLAGSRAGIETHVEDLHGRKSAAIDVLTGWRSDSKNGVLLMSKAIKEIKTEHLGGDKEAQEFGRRGGKASAKAKNKRRTPRETAQKIWFDMTLSNEEAVDKINSFGYGLDWSERGLYNNFKKRGAVMGRPATKK